MLRKDLPRPWLNVCRREWSGLVRLAVIRSYEANQDNVEVECLSRGVRGAAFLLLDEGESAFSHC